MLKRNLLIPYLLLICYLLLLAGCATVPYISAAKPEMGIPGIYHRVEKGETLWRISKIYGIDLNEIARVNHIWDATKIEIGQFIFIPHGRVQPYTAHRFNPAEDFIWPIRGKVITTFGQTFNNMINKGLNIQPYGSGEVVASRAGRIIFYSDDFKGFGKTIIIDHGDGFSTIYSKNSQVFIKVCDNVQKGTQIAKVNKYLHFQIRKEHVPQNPYFYLSQ